MEVLYFGNRYVNEDNLAIKVAEKLRDEFLNVNFRHVENTFQLIDMNFNDKIILDVVKGFYEAKIINSEDIKSGSLTTTHDFDLGFFLRLSGKNARIIGIPMGYDFEKAVSEVRLFLKNQFSCQLTLRK